MATAIWPRIEGNTVIENITAENDGQGSPSPPGDLAALEGKLNELSELFKQRILYDEAKERSFNVLYEKMQQYQGDYQSSLKRGLVLSLLLLHDHMQKAEDTLEENLGAQCVSDLRTELLDILYAEGVEPIGTLPEVFDRSRQEAVGTVQTTDRVQDNTVERIIREGFLSSGKVLRPQSVIVRRYQVPASQEETRAKGEECQ